MQQDKISHWRGKNLISLMLHKFEKLFKFVSIILVELHSNNLYVLAAIVVKS